MKDKVKSFIKAVFPETYYPKLAKLYVRSKYLLIRFQCPFCRRSFGHLLPAGHYLPVFKEKNIIGGGYRLDALCPGCGCSDRERLVYVYLKRNTDTFARPISLLHVAPEENLQRMFKRSSNIDYLSADLDPSKAMVKVDITDIHYEDNTFDVIICNHVLEHVPDDKRAMEEIYRVLKLGGWAILQVPISMALETTFEDPTAPTPQERERLFGQEDHVRIYGKDYNRRLESAGFFVELFDPVQEFGRVTVFREALLRRERIYVCRKKGNNGDGCETN